jgi:thiol reductant ABC exporter CydC subunit
MMFIAYLLGAFAFIGGIGLTVSSGWLITMASLHPPILTLGVSIVLVRFFGIFRSVARYGERLISHKAVFERLTDLRTSLYEKLVERSIAISHVVNSGASVKTLVDDVERAQEYQLRIKLPGSSAILALAAGTLLGWWVHPESLLITVPASLILLFGIPLLISRFTVPLAEEIEARENMYTQVIESSVHGVIEAQIYGYLDQSLVPAAQEELEIVKSEKKLLSKSGIFSFSAYSIIALAIVGSTWLANSITRHDQLPAVQVAMLIFLPLVMFEAITSWYPNLFGSGKLLASQRAVDDLLAKSEEIPKTIALQETITTFECVDVRVSWHVEFMQSFSCEVSKGELLVIRGKSGVGKSTLAMGMLGLLPYQGSIAVNGRELSGFTDLNQHIVGTVQKSHIFNTSIRENLKVGNPTASDDHIMSVLAMVELDGLVAEMGNGLDTIIGDFGRIVSGGEAKRLAIARTLLSDADVYIFDEPTEHLDHQLAARIELAITSLMREKIAIVITHTGWNAADKTLTMLR